MEGSAGVMKWRGQGANNRRLVREIQRFVRAATRATTHFRLRPTFQFTANELEQLAASRA